MLGLFAETRESDMEGDCCAFQLLIESGAFVVLGLVPRLVHQAKPLDPYDLDAWKPAMATKDRLKDFRELGASVRTLCACFGKRQSILLRTL